MCVCVCVCAFSLELLHLGFGPGPFFLGWGQQMWASTWARDSKGRSWHGRHQGWRGNGRRCGAGRRRGDRGGSGAVAGFGLFHSLDKNSWLVVLGRVGGVRRGDNRNRRGGHHHHTAHHHLLLLLLLLDELSSELQQTIADPLDLVDFDVELEAACEEKLELELVQLWQVQTTNLLFEKKELKSKRG